MRKQMESKGRGKRGDKLTAAYAKAGGQTRGPTAMPGAGREKLGGHVTCHRTAFSP